MDIVNNQLININNISDYILETYGIKTEVLNIDNKPAIRVLNHFSLFSLITKIRHDFDFHVFHKKGNNEYLLYIKI